MSVVLLSEDEEVSGHMRRPCVGQGRCKVSFDGSSWFLVNDEGVSRDRERVPQTLRARGPCWNGCC
jgi:hypothetical protein